ncbi:MAG: response regulator [Fimbriimonadaceae bacterium]|nr:response regulator [Fimbriimonadaceae bacterium]
MKRQRLLLVEDDPLSQELVSRVVDKEFPHVDLCVAYSGRDALTFLEVDGDELTVDLVLLDLQIPLPDGKEVLARMRSLPATRHLPVVVLSGSEDPADLERCRELGASFVRKPADYDAYVEAVRNTLRYWCETVAW